MKNACFFIGQRDTPETVYPLLLKAVIRHIRDFGVTEFLAGRYGAFDSLAAKAVREAKADFPLVRLILLLPYYRPDRAVELPPGFDGSFYPPGLETVPKRLAIVRANTYAADHCSYLISYSRRTFGNSRALLEHAERRAAQGLLHVENLAERKETVP